LLAFDIGAQNRLVLGGRYGWPGKRTAFDITPTGSLQLREYKPYQNILQMLDKKDDEGVVWFPDVWEDKRVDYDKSCGLPPELSGYVEGEDPRVWRWNIHPIMFDGDPRTAHTLPVSLMRAPHRYNYIFDTGVPVRVNRFVFYPKWSDELITPGNWYVGSPFYESYMRQYVVSASLYNEPPSPRRYLADYEPLDFVLEKNMANYKKIVNIEFPLKPLRFFILDPRSKDYGFTLAEIELYGQGFSPEAWYTSKIIDLKGPMNFGRIFYDLKKFRWRKEWSWKEPEEPGEYSELDLGRKSVKELWEERLIDPVPVEDPDAPVRVEVKVRTGKDDTPLIYYRTDDMLDERGEVVSREEYLKLGVRRMEFNRIYRPYVGMRGILEPDRDNWSDWVTVEASGEEVGIPDVRRYIQFQVRMYSEDPWAFGRLDSIWIELSPPLADEVLGEVCVEGTPMPEKGVAEVEVGMDTSFVLALKASAPGRREVFDAVRIFTPVRPKFEELRIGGKQEDRDSLHVGDRYLEVFLPREVGDDEPVEVRFRTAVLSYSTNFFVEVWDRGRELIPQRAVSGDAVDWIGTNQLQVFAAARSLEVLKDFHVAPVVVTPNGDGSNDSTEVTYTISLVMEGAKVELGVYDMAGRMVRKLVEEETGSAFGKVKGWNGRDEDGRLVLPGVYLVKISVETDQGRTERAVPVIVVY